MSDLSTPAFYFPIRGTPYRFEAGLHRFGTDFGNGPADRNFFQLDREWPRYRRARARVPAHRAGVLTTTPAQRRTHRVVLAWLSDRLEREHPGRGSFDALPSGAPLRDYAHLTSRVQEDLTVLMRPSDRDEARAIAVFVDQPSGWRPERILGGSFEEIHGPVPAFAKRPGQAASMTTGLIERGPFVRFVWTVTADDALDHHPEEGGARPWREDGRGWLRVERQVTVPFPAEGAGLFLIRTYLYPFESLTGAQRTRLRLALDAMPDPIARYKGLEGEPRRIATKLLLD